MAVNAPRAEATGARLLVVDDEPAMVRTLRTNLRGHGFQVETAETATDAKASYDRRQPDLVVLDINLPDGDGFEIVRHIRERSGTPIIVLSARGGEHDKVNALDLGADDYMTKPFGIDELLARIRVALRHVARPNAGAEPRIRSGDLVIDLERRDVSVAGRAVHLTPTEYDLLQVFITNPNKHLPARAGMRVIVVVARLDRPTVRALGYARSIAGHVSAVHVANDDAAAEGIRRSWRRLDPGPAMDLVVIRSRGDAATALGTYLDALTAADPARPLGVVLSGVVPRARWSYLLQNRAALRLTLRLLSR